MKKPIEERCLSPFALAIALVESMQIDQNKIEH